LLSALSQPRKPQIIRVRAPLPPWRIVNSPPSFGGWMISLLITGGLSRSLPIRCRSLRGISTISPGPTASTSPALPSTRR
jgi:hypothetical protein